MTSVTLIPLLCPKCKAPINAQVDELAWACEQCGQGMIIDARQGAKPQSIFFSVDVKPGQKGHPYWVSRGQVSLAFRETYKGDEGKAARAFWAEPRLFFIPAWECTLDEVISIGTALLKNPAGIQTGSPVPFLPVVASPNDINALAEFLIFSIEAERRDALKSVKFDLNLDPPQLWILP